MTAKKFATLAGIKALDDQERPREFKPCSTCRHSDVMFPSQPHCAMFGWMRADNARQLLCGKYGDAWRAIEPSDFAAISMVDRVLG